MALASPWATWHAGLPRRTAASSIAGRSSRMRLAVCAISTAQPAGRTAEGAAPNRSATRRASTGRRRLAGAKRLSSTAAATSGDRPGSHSLRSAASTSARRSTSAASSPAKSAASAVIGNAARHLTAAFSARARSFARNADGRIRALMDYREAGVDIPAADAAKARIKALARGTFNPAVLSEIGSFGALFRPDLARYREPVLVASTDGVGTKIRVAVLAGVHDTVGHDLVAHFVHDLLVQGATPPLFLAYIALGRMDPERVEQILRGLVRACAEFGCPLIGGETAEMPGTYAADDYDLAGFIVGAVEKDQALTGARVREGDAIL